MRSAASPHTTLGSRAALVALAFAASSCLAGALVLAAREVEAASAAPVAVRALALRRAHHLHHGVGQRLHDGRLDAYVPPSFEAGPDGWDVVLHFHGLSSLQERNVEAARLGAAVVSLNAGIGTEAYAQAVTDERTFERMLDAARRAVEASGRAPNLTVRRVALSAWSAGFASVGRLLGRPDVAERVDAVLLADGLHTSWADERQRQVNQAGLERFVELGRRATRGEALFALTHSSIKTYGYPSTTETTAELLNLLDVPRGEAPPPPAEGLVPLYAARRGSFSVVGFEGETAPDHMRHIQAMDATLYGLLRERWRGRAAPAPAAPP